MPLTAASENDDKKRPNILWLVGEDANIKWFGCYGSRSATTPNIDRLAKEGFRYTNAYATAPVCAASRSSWITGLYSLSTGTHPMRSRYDIPHELISYYPDALRKAGYYCSNHTKTDYNIGGRPDGDCWDSAEEYGWKLRKPGQPFFCVINYMESHESRVFGSVENTRHDPSKVVLEKYHPDVADIRKNYALYEDAVENMDKHLGIALAKLKESGLEEETIVVFCTDHGGVMPRSKRFTYESGLHSPLIIRIPEKYKNLWPANKPGMSVDRLVSFVDMPKTWLSLGQAEISTSLQGKVFLGPEREKEPSYCFSYRGRMDERYDETRSVRDKRFLYVKNYMPFVKWGQHLDYLWKMTAMQSWEKSFKEGKCDGITGQFFKTKPSVEELYDCEKDPDCVQNLSTNPEYNQTLIQMRKALTAWQLEIHDSGLLPESELVKRAAENKTTIYQLVRNPKLYNLEAYLKVADIALSRDNSHLDQLVDYLKDPDSGIRYWGACGLMMENKLDSSILNLLEKSLNDSSHEVRAMAAWALIKAGQNKGAQDCLKQLIDQRSYALLKVLNIIDWMGSDQSPYLPLIQSIKYPVEPRSNEMNYYITAMRNYFINPVNPQTSQARGEIQKDELSLNKELLELKD